MTILVIGRRSGLVLALSLAACGGGTSTPQRSDGGGPGTLTSVVGSGTVMGSADGTPFASVGAALWIGMPDSVVSGSSPTTVVYVFSKPVVCSSITKAGWDAKIDEHTQVIEMKQGAASPGKYTVVTTPSLAATEASVNYTLSSKLAAGPMEMSATGGTVTLAALNAKKSATGSFDLEFGANKLSGIFDAAYCDGGREP